MHIRKGKFRQQKFFVKMYILFKQNILLHQFLGGKGLHGSELSFFAKSLLHFTLKLGGKTGRNTPLNGRREELRGRKH